MNALQVFRKISFAEGVSLLVLLFIAMPMKYIMEIPEAVKIVGWIHGLLFIVYVGMLLIVQVKVRWSFIFFAGAFIASVIPFGTFVLEKQIQKKYPAGA